MEHTASRNNKNNKQKKNRQQLKARRQGNVKSVAAVAGNVHRDLQLTSQVVKARIFQNPNGFTADQVNAAFGAASPDVTAALAAIDKAVTSLGTAIVQATAANAAGVTSPTAPATDATPAAAT